MTAINEAVLKEMNLTQEQWTEINGRVTSQAPQGDDMQKYTQYSQLFAAEKAKWVTANSKTPTAEEIEEINKAAHMSLPEAQQTAHTEYQAAIAAGQSPTPAQTEANNAFVAAQ